MDTEDVLNDPIAAITADVQRMLTEAHDAIKVFQDIQSRAVREQNAEAKALVATLKSNELVRLKARVPELGERLARVTAGVRERMDSAKTANQALDAAIRAFGKRMQEPRR